MSFKNIDYSSFVGLIRERNRPSGGIKTVHSVAKNAFINKEKKMLEIGSNTGFTCINMNLLTECECVGVDVNKQSIDEAKRIAKKHSINDKVSFFESNATELPFEDNTFDIVWCSNVTSFIKEREKAISEYLRVLKFGGTLVVVPIYYNYVPPKEVISNVSNAIGNQISIMYKNDWINLFEKNSNNNNVGLELYFSEDFSYMDVENKIGDYMNKILEKPHLKELSNENFKKIKNKGNYFMKLFNENLKYAGYSIFLFQKRKEKEEIELFETIKY